MTHLHTRLVGYPVPLRPDAFAELRLPIDLTAEEAERMARFVSALAIAEQPGEIDQQLHEAALQRLAEER